MDDQPQEEAAPPTPPETPKQVPGGTGVRIGAIIAVAVLAAVVVWALVDWNDDSSAVETTTDTTVTGEATGPIKLAVSGIRNLSSASGQPIYWIGRRPGNTLEFIRTADGKVYLRYLPPGVKVGDPRDDFTIVGTYPFPDAFRSLQQISGDKGVAVPGGGIALVHEGYPQSVHVAYPDVDYQIEVYDPSPARALELATSEALRPITD
jgi:hypothetical protein